MEPRLDAYKRVPGALLRCGVWKLWCESPVFLISQRRAKIRGSVEVAVRTHLSEMTGWSRAAPSHGLAVGALGLCASLTDRTGAPHHYTLVPEFSLDALALRP
jgi:hypothetical protein